VSLRDPRRAPIPRGRGLGGRGAASTLLGIILVAAVWEILHLALGTSALPSPLEAATTLAELFRRDMATHLAASLLRVLAATVVQVVLGSALGLALGASARAEALVGPAVRVLYPVPKIAFLPLFMILFGIGEVSKVLFVAAVVVFQTVISVRDGVAEIPPALFLSARSLGMGRRGLYRHLYAPAILPRVFTSIRLGLGAGMSALFFAENYATRHGVGYLIMSSYAMADYRSTFAGILALSLLALALFALVDAAEGRACPWLRAGHRGGD